MTVVVPSITPTGQGTTLARYRYRLADELGYFQETTVSETAEIGDAARVVLADELRDDELGVPSGLAPWQGPGLWVHASTGDQAGVSRRVVSQPGVGYQGEEGALVVSREFPAPLEAGTTILVTSPLPVRSVAGTRGLDSFVNAALDRIWVEARLEVLGDGTDEIDLAPYPFLVRAGDVIQAVYDQRSSADSAAPRRSSAPWRVVTHGPEQTLVLGTRYSQDQPISLDVLVRASRLVYDGLTWTYVETPGLQGDDWQAACPEAWVLAFGMVKALEYLERRPSPEGKPTLPGISERRQMWAAAAAAIKRTEFPRMPAVQSRPVTWAETSDAWSR